MYQVLAKKSEQAVYALASAKTYIKIGADLAINNLMNDGPAMKRLISMGMSVPPGLGALENYNNVQE